MTQPAQAGCTSRGGILGRRKRLPSPYSGAASKSSISALSTGIDLAGTLPGSRTPTQWPPGPPGHSLAQRARYERSMVLSVMDRTAPVLIDRADAIAILDASPGVFDRWLREGRLDNMVMVGDRHSSGPSRSGGSRAPLAGLAWPDGLRLYATIRR
jgi:hypothetical protein